MAFIISLMGIDGSGKSSLGTLLVEELTSRGMNSQMSWVCLRPVLLRPIAKTAKFLLVRKHKKFENYEKHITAKKAGLKKFSWAHGIYFWVMILDYIPQVVFKVWLPRLAGRNVICDRYYHDLMLDYGVTISANIDRILKLTALSERLFPKPDLLCFLDVSPEVAMSRKTDIPALEYLTERADIYTGIAERFNALVLDASLPLEVNCKRLADEIEALSRA